MGITEKDILKTVAIDVPNMKEQMDSIVTDTNAKFSGVETKKADKSQADNIQQQVNNLVLNGDGTQNLEVVQARGYEATLNDRISKNENNLNTLPIYKQTNLANISGKQVGYWTRANTTQELSVSNSGGYTVIPRIELKRGLKYYISNFFPNFTWVMKKSDPKVTIVRFDGISATEPYVYTATEDCYLYVTYTGQHDDIMVVENADKKPSKYLKFNEFKTYIDGFKYEYDEFGNKINIITVKKDGGGDCNSLAKAITLCTNTSLDNQYKILLYDGSYNAIEEMGGATYLNAIMSMNGAYAGFLLPEYVHLIGMGKTQDDVIIKANVEEYSSLAFNILDNAVTKLSPLNLEKSNNIENLTIQGQNCRYALHDESNNSYKDYVRKMKNVKIVHKGNDSKYTWRSSNGVGAGSGSGAMYEYENCTFEGTLPYSIHDNTNFTKPNKFLFNNCRFLAFRADKIACRFVTVSLENETIAHDVEINNCQFRGTLGQYEEATGKGRKFYVHGGGNSVVPYIYTNTSASATTKPIAFNEEVQVMYNKDTVTITKGSLVRVFASGVFKLTTSEKHLFYGIALEDIPSMTNGHIKIGGYVYVNDTGLASFNVGDKIGINNGNLVVTTGSDYIGVATDWNVMLLK